jgi:hypothetical protein
MSNSLKLNASNTFSFPPLSQQFSNRFRCAFDIRLCICILRRGSRCYELVYALRCWNWCACRRRGRRFVIIVVGSTLLGRKRGRVSVLGGGEAIAKKCVVLWLLVSCRELVKFRLGGSMKIRGSGLALKKVKRYETNDSIRTL